MDGGSLSLDLDSWDDKAQRRTQDTGMCKGRFTCQRACIHYAHVQQVRLSSDLSPETTNRAIHVSDRQALSAMMSKSSPNREHWSSLPASQKHQLLPPRANLTAVGS
eukprot:1320358-Amorphochlora_amoeboformis.AAC.1